MSPSCRCALLRYVSGCLINTSRASNFALRLLLYITLLLHVSPFQSRFFRRTIENPPLITTHKMKSFAILALAGLAVAQFNQLPTCAVRRSAL